MNVRIAKDRAQQIELPVGEGRPHEAADAKPKNLGRAPATLLFAGAMGCLLLGARTPQGRIETPKVARWAASAGEDESPLAKSLGLELTGIKPLAAPSNEVLGRISKATSTGLEFLGNVNLFRAERSGGSPLFLARVPLLGSEAGDFALLALDSSKDYVASSVVDTKGEVVDEWTHFMGVLKFTDVPRLEGAEPWTAVEERLAEAREDDGEDARLLVAMFEVQRLMNEQASVFNLPADRRERSEVEEAELMAKSYEGLVELAPDLAPLLGESSEAFVDSAERAAELAWKLRQAIEDKNVHGGRGIQRRIMGNCKSCHNLDSSSGEGDLKDASYDLRQELGIGTGTTEWGTICEPVIPSANACKWSRMD